MSPVIEFAIMSLGLNSKAFEGESDAKASEGEMFGFEAEVPGK